MDVPLGARFCKQRVVFEVEGECESHLDGIRLASGECVSSLPAVQKGELREGERQFAACVVDSRAFSKNKR